MATVFLRLLARDDKAAAWPKASNVSATDRTAPTSTSSIRSRSARSRGRRSRIG